MNYAELARRIENICRYGTVETIDHENKTITVNLGDITTTNIRWAVLRSGTDKTWDAPSFGEECAVISPCGELALGFAIFGFYNENNPSPESNPALKLRLFEDGTVICYDTENHALTAILVAGGTATLTATGGITINGDTTINGNVTTNGNVQTNGNTAMTGDNTVGGSQSVDGTSLAKGSLTCNGDVTASGISLKNHTHGGVQGGSSDTGGPK
ncbi:phage baseplate assembly protein V [Acinetobacter populi]|uniref:Baseplate assembly protein n=1 Tax=Acinetobacter populi TaxID=1582270 RepID=A0A1Z9Z2N2_9GAMM|nr:phage baseplate assembly protein V [Acinetobacter populi]OUY08706.1 baseplate assembly protein [Acinetobacter populi]